MFKDIIAIAFPELCVGCQNTLLKAERHLCLSCLTNMSRNTRNSFDNVDVKVFLQANYITGASYLLNFDKKGVVQRIIHQIKYGSNPKLANYMGELMGVSLPKHYFDLIIPVPLHKKRERKRGYNQSLEIAKGIENVTGVSIDSSSFIRTINTESQTKKNKQEREENVYNAFRCLKIDGLTYNRILLVDDVVTTGVTINVCAQTIKSINPQIEIFVYSLAFTKI